MTKIINLNRARKAAERSKAKAKAESNRAKHGRTKAEKLAQRAQEARDKAHLDGHRLDSDAEQGQDKSPGDDVSTPQGAGEEQDDS